MTFSVTIVDADHRADVYAEIEHDGELIAEAFPKGGRMRLTLVDHEGRLAREFDASEFTEALKKARDALIEAGLL